MGAEEGGVPIIYSLIRSCNRSKPHMEVLRHAIRILHNLSVCKETTEAAYAEDGAVNLIAEQMQMYRDKEEIFVPACELICVWCKDAAKLEELRGMQNVAQRL